MINPIDPKDIINQLSDGRITLNFNLKDWEEILLIALENGGSPPSADRAPRTDETATQNKGEQDEQAEHGS